ncbi:hypothetical protein [Aquisalimonas asiatica]|uniref:Uncharacterized protein n=1 Tax=Aquisalimonas asiatica TaxID=406100 RepID=A0A1H8UFB5_9GAMM|nr:hypothetical protein [Aquisalimonas asiatica]SEP01861.1 hypothetical protein SAMN04488052_106165 [Aquisalimonas asiatica]
MAEQYASADAEIPAPGTLSETVGYAVTLFRRYVVLLLPIALFAHGFVEWYFVFQSRAFHKGTVPGVWLLVLQTFAVMVYCWAWMLAARLVHEREVAGGEEPFNGHVGLFGQAVLLVILCLIPAMLSVMPLLLHALLTGGSWLPFFVAVAVFMYLATRLWLTPVVMSTEDLWPMDAFGRSWALTSGLSAHFMTLGVVVFMLVATVLPAVLWKSVLGSAFFPAYVTDDGAAVFWWIGAVVVGMLLFPLFVTTSVAALLALEARDRAKPDTDERIGGF